MKFTRTHSVQGGAAGGAGPSSEPELYSFGQSGMIGGMAGGLAGGVAGGGLGDGVAGGGLSAKPEPTSPEPESPEPVDSLSHRPSHRPSEPTLDSPETAESRHARIIRQLAGGDDLTSRRDMSARNVSLNALAAWPNFRGELTAEDPFKGKRESQTA